MKLLYEEVAVAAVKSAVDVSDRESRGAAVEFIVEKRRGYDQFVGREQFG